MDVILASVGLLVTWPVLLVVAALTRLKLGRPILFRQVRPGLHGRPFTLYKFRTMRSDWDGEGSALPDEERLTDLGRLLRATSLDELPELWNVLRGDMSLVGPRPLLMEYVALYNREQFRRHEARPGITGWAQVNGRNALTWEQKFELDTWYVDNQSLRLDLKILGMTFVNVLKRRDISQPGYATAQPFRGSERADGLREDAAIHLHAEERC